LVSKCKHLHLYINFSGGKEKMKKRVLSVLLIAAMAVTGLSACGSSDQGSSSDAAVSAGAEADASNDGADAVATSDIKVGEIESYVINDGGWCQATHEGIVNAMDELGVSEDNLIVLENIDDTDQASVQAAAEQLIEEGCTLIIGASTGYASFLPEIAAEYPEVTFAQWGTKVDGLVGYEIRSYEAMFLAGYACELMSENPQLGFSASYDEFSVRTAINAYALGAKYANPDATVKVACADSWYDIDKETQCAQSLIDAGITYMGMEASSPAIPQTCEKNGAYVVGYHNDMSELAPDAVLVSFTWNFAPIFKQIMESVQDGTVSTDDYYYLGGECAKLTDFASFVPDDVVAAVDDLKAKIDSGEVQVYAGELKDDEGNVLVNKGEVMDDETILLQEFFVDNVDCAW
jgi:basic membrane lipoprotein Med (substrate-binding protein (PBP1-ABC) superfamily)